MEGNLEDIFADVKKEGESIDSLFPSTETETPSESQPENEPETEQTTPETSTEEVQEENVPFHKHPRWIEREERLQTLEQELEDLRSQREQTVTSTGSEEVVVPDSFKRLYGDDPVAYQAWREEQARLKDEVKRELIEEQMREIQEKAESESYWNNWVDTQISALEAAGKQLNRNELMEVMLEFKPTDESGNLDFEAGYKIYEATRPKDTTTVTSPARKKVAASMTSTSTSERKTKDYLTPSDLRNKSWDQL